MKVLLIYPYCLEARLHEEEISVPPIGIYYVGAMLKENKYDVDVLNWHDINRTPHLIHKTLSEKKPDVIGFSILHANRWGAIEIARIARKIIPDVKIVFGGIGATFLWEHLLIHFEEVDVVVIGEGEKPFLQLVKCVESKDYDRLEDIKGIAFRKDGAILTTGNAEPVHDLDEIPNPAKYFTYQHVAATRGCPGKCTFCGSPQFWGTRVRFHSPEYFVEQLVLQYRKGITFFYFSDDTFTINKDHVIRVCKTIIERGLNISWVAISRVNYVDAEILYWMRKAGCTQISYGVESGSETIRNRVLNKRISADHIKNAFELTTQYGILARAYFIYGSPGESWDTIEETLELMRTIKPLSVIFYILDLFPGTALYSQFLQKTGNSDDIWLKQIEDILYFETDPDLDQKQILAFGQRLRSDFHKNLPVFVDAIELIEQEDLFERHADFLSRLGMTFSHGDYAGIGEIERKDRIAEKLFKKALTYYPDHRAYLGLGLLYQQSHAIEQSMKILLEGIRRFPESEQLTMCLGINHMNLREYEKALSYFLKFRQTGQFAPYIAECYGALGDYEHQTAFLKKIPSSGEKPG